MSKEREFRGRMRWFGCRFRFVVYGGSGERKNRFIESYMTRDMYVTRNKIKTPIAFVFIRVS